jgi:hypothetical protein
LFAAGSWNRLLLEPEARKYVSAGQNADGIGHVEYSRPSSDVIDVAANSAEPGFVRVLESFDPGWTATVDGRAAPVLPANGFEMAVPVGSGSHVVRLRYETPGRMTGDWLSLASLLMLAGLIAGSGSPGGPNTWAKGLVYYKFEPEPGSGGPGCSQQRNTAGNKEIDFL